MSHRANGLESNVNESTVWYIQGKEEKMHLFVCKAAPQSTKLTPILFD